MPAHVTRQIDDTIPLAGSKKTVFSFEDFDHSSIPFEEERWPVVIISSSMVGMSLGLLLGYHGVRSVSFDRHPLTAIHPRAALFLLRAMEIFRQLRLEELFQKESAKNFDLDAGMIIVERLVAGKVIASIQESDPKEVAKVSPSVRLWLTQNMFESLLRQNAKDYGALQVFGETVVHYEEQADGVVVVVQNTETKAFKKYRADYLVACDGNRSATRAKENIECYGPGVLGDAISINFKADLTPYLGTRAVHGVTYISNSNIDVGFRLESGGKGGFQIVTRTGDRNGFPPDSVTEKEARKYFYDASGLDHEINLEVESIPYWTTAGFRSERFGSKNGRVFIAGDAAHVMPPSGGMGGNTGIQDAHNLAWKLAYVIHGIASPTLLESYTAERMPAAKFAMQRAYSRFQKRVVRKKPDVEELPDIVCEIGYRYFKGAFVESGPPSGLWEDPYSPLAASGCRLPHVELIGEHATRVSTLDLVHTNFILIAVENSSPWIEAAGSLALPIDGYVLSDDSIPFRDPHGKVKDVCKFGEGEVILIRPDGVIAWRGGRMVDGDARVLKESLDTLLR